MSESYHEVTDQDLVGTPNYLNDEPVTTPVAGGQEVLVRDADDELLDLTQDVRKRILENVSDKTTGGIANDKDSMMIAIMAARDIDAQALKKKTLVIKRDANVVQGDTARLLESMTRRLLEQGMTIVGQARREQRNLDPSTLPTGVIALPGEFAEEVTQETSEDFFARMDAKR